MTKKTMLAGCLLCAFVMVSSASAADKDFTITVPVRLYKMVQGVGKVKVICEVLDSQGQRIGSASKWSTNHVNAYPTGLEEDIVLEFNANPGKDPRTATAYKCELKLQLAWINDEPWQTPSQSSNSMYLKPKPGTEFRVEDSGPIHQAPNIQKLGINPKIKLRR